MIYLETHSHDPYFNLALEEALFSEETGESYLWLWQNDNTIVIGKNQDAGAEVNQDYCDAHGIKISRRMTGGGAVYHDLGNINFTFIEGSRGGRTVDFLRFTEPVARALSRFGVNVEHSGRNDLLIDGHKFSGNAQFVGKDKVIHHGTLMFSSDLSIIGHCLTPDKAKLLSHGVKSTKSRVTTIAEHLPQPIDLTTFWKQLVEYLLEAYEGVTVRPLTDAERAAAEHLRDTKYGTREWIFGTQGRAFNEQRAERFEGCGSVYAALQLEGGVIRDIRLSGDFFGAGDARDIEKALKGVAFEQGAVKAALAGCDVASIIHNLPQDGLLTLLFGA